MNKKLTSVLDFSSYLKSAKNIDKAVSSVLENSISIFLPYKRLDKTLAFKEFEENDRTLELKNDIFEKVEIKSRLLSQVHKDILEALLSSKKTFDKHESYFKVKISAHQLFKKMKKKSRNKKWLLQQIEHISQARLKLHFNENESFDFSFISSIRSIEDMKQLEISFTREYTYFLAKNELLDYRNYIDDIMSLRDDIKEIEEKIRIEKKQKIRSGFINVDFIKAVVRYVLTNNGKNSQIRIETLKEKLNLNKVMSKREIEYVLIDLRRKEIQELLKNKFNITLTNEEKTLTFNAQKSKYFIKSIL